MGSSFLTYRSGRWLWIALASALVLVIHYLYYRSRTVAYGGSFEGLLYGVVGTGLIAVLMYLGIRKRSYSSSSGTLQGWVSAHVYLGLLTLLLIPMHAGFRFGWDVHTLAFVLLSVVVLSGIVGIILYLNIPSRLTKFEAGQQADKIDGEMGRLLVDMRALVKDKSDALVQLYKSEVTALQKARPQGWSLLLKGQGSDLLALRSADLAEKVSSIPPEDQAAFQILSQLLLKNAQLKLNLMRQMRLRNALQAWLYVHVPVSIALVVAVVLHLVMVFVY
jgi:hypothetical protein